MDSVSHITCYNPEQLVSHQSRSSNLSESEHHQWVKNQVDRIGQFAFMKHVHQMQLQAVEKWRASLAKSSPLDCPSETASDVSNSTRAGIQPEVDTADEETADTEDTIDEIGPVEPLKRKLKDDRRNQRRRARTAEKTAARRAKKDSDAAKLVIYEQNEAAFNAN